MSSLRATAIALFLLSLVATPATNTLVFVGADWIDPATPKDKRKTQPFTSVPGKIPKHTPKKLNATETLAPTETLPPTDAPTTMPSAYPTFTPDTFELVFSDEFNVPGRTFADGSDPRWTAMEKNDYTNDALHYYAASNAVTDEEGNLVITTEAVDTDVVGYDDVKRKKSRLTKHFRSAMLQSWNKFCFTGGIVEAEVELPGKHNIGGLWPAFWLLGNLARHTYVGSSEHIWPWSSNACTARSFASQQISGCSEVAHYGLQAGVGRGSPEIDIFEVQPGNEKAGKGAFAESSVGQPFMSASFQVAPGRPNMRPGNGYWPGPGQWYEGLVGGNSSVLNIAFYGNYNHFAGDTNPEKSDYWSDAVSFNRQLQEKHFATKHKYRLEWDVPTDEKDGYLHWFLDGELVLSINGTGIRTAGTGSEVSTEPMYILLNTAVSSQWGFPRTCPGNCKCKKFDCNSEEHDQRCGFSEGFCQMMQDNPEYKINYVRVYQNPDNEEQKVGCSTPERPTRRYIEAHQKLYKTEQDEHPLKGVPRGLGRCDPRTKDDSPNNCGGRKRGRCTAGKVCECRDGWTGPHCLANDGFDDIVWDEPDKITDVGFVPPQFLPNGLLFGLVVIVIALFITMRWKNRMEGWTPIPDVDSKLLR